MMGLMNRPHHHHHHLSHPTLDLALGDDRWREWIVIYYYHHLLHPSLDDGVANRSEQDYWEPVWVGELVHEGSQIQD
jgi:hypothetical protein